MTPETIRHGFRLAGAVNIVGILTVTYGLTRDTITMADPEVFSTFGLLMIMLWGLAYIGTAPWAAASVLLPLTFAIEKLAYVVNWAAWQATHRNELPSISEQDVLGSLFLNGYGVLDGLFCVFFAHVALRNWRNRRTRAS